jgi:hypothetical protein
MKDVKWSGLGLEARAAGHWVLGYLLIWLACVHCSIPACSGCPLLWDLEFWVWVEEMGVYWMLLLLAALPLLVPVYAAPWVLRCFAPEGPQRIKIIIIVLCTPCRLSLRLLRLTRSGVYIYLYRSVCELIATPPLSSNDESSPLPPPELSLVVPASRRPHAQHAGRLC